MHVRRATLKGGGETSKRMAEDAVQFQAALTPEQRRREGRMYPQFFGGQSGAGASRVQPGRTSNFGARRGVGQGAPRKSHPRAAPASHLQQRCPAGHSYRRRSKSHDRCTARISRDGIYGETERTPARSHRRVRAAHARGPGRFSHESDRQGGGKAHSFRLGGICRTRTPSLLPHPWP